MTRALGMMLLVMAVVLAGCAAPQERKTVEEMPIMPECSTKECFIDAANECKDVRSTFAEESGTFVYASSNDCVLTKTLVSAHPGESPEMKALLEGKSMTCKYERGSFDERWVTSLVFGSENCEGGLKDAIAQLLVFI